MKTALILGAAVWADGPSPTLVRRTLAAARLYHDGAVQRIIACGGLGAHPPSEAEAMAEILTGAGVLEDHIALEDRSTNTGENIRFALPLLPAPEIIIVSDWYHLPRAKLVARRAGLKPVGIAAPARGAKPAAQIKAVLREALAYAAYASRIRS